MVLAGLLAPPAGAAEPADAALHAWRAARRAAVAAAARAKADAAPATFGLLVLPVDFADARFPDPAAARDSLARRLADDTPGTLRHYFRVASRGRLDLRVVLGPVVHLPAERREYSDRDRTGHWASRRLARQSLASAVSLGLDLRLADDDGPDGRPASGDDDGRVDGVLLLHAAPGLENDPDAGWIEPLQYYLAQQLVDRGVAADAYAVAAARSGVGVWAHETGHLLGLEDRYDLFLPPRAGDVAGRGGLGRFSLMAAGALGTGGGERPALPDAYSALALGWVEAVDVARPWACPESLAWRGAGGPVWRLAAAGGDDYFLLEARGGGTDLYDAAVPAGLVIYHVDPAVPEAGQSSSDPGQRHLRVRLVEADGDGALAAGEDDGSTADVFPGSLGRHRWGPATYPPSDGYTGPSGILLDGIATGPGGVSATVTAPGDPFTWAAGFQEAAAGTTLTLTVMSALPLAGDPAVTVEPVEPENSWGAFATADGRVDVTLVPDGPCRWRLPAPVRWVPWPGMPAGAVTLFRVRFAAAELAVDQVAHWSWQWRDLPDPLSPAGEWPGSWQVQDDGLPGTAWQRWDVTGAPGWPPGYVLACTGPAAGDGTDAADVTYANGADLRLVSPAFRGGESWIRLLHWLDADTVHAGEGGDGAVVFLETGQGDRLLLTPVDGFPGRLAGRAAHSLAGRAGWTGPGPRDADGAPLWREDVLPLPAAAAGGGRLVLAFASDIAWRGRGWFVAAVERVPAGSAPFRLTALPGGGWRAVWSGAGDLQELRLEGSPDGRDTWRPLLVTHDPVLETAGGAVLPGDGSARWLRAVALFPWGAVGTPARAVALPEPYRTPLRLAARPGGGTVRFLLAAPRAGRLELFDLRGRRLWRRDYVPGTYLEIWDGRDAHGRRAGAGLYLARLRAGGEEARCRFLLVR